MVHTFQPSNWEISGSDGRQARHQGDRGSIVRVCRQATKSDGRVHPAVHTHTHSHRQTHTHKHSESE